MDPKLDFSFNWNDCYKIGKVGQPPERVAITNVFICCNGVDLQIKDGQYKIKRGKVVVRSKLIGKFTIQLNRNKIIPELNSTQQGKLSAL